MEKGAEREEVCTPETAANSTLHRTSTREERKKERKKERRKLLQFSAQTPFRLLFTIAVENGTPQKRRYTSSYSTTSNISLFTIAAHANEAVRYKKKKQKKMPYGFANTVSTYNDVKITASCTNERKPQIVRLN